jgi:hypothetical protein
MHVHNAKMAEALMIQTPWAILLCKFDDDTSEPYTRQRYEDLFTNSGVGKLNMVDYFRDMSHGMLDLSGSQVFGWFSLHKNRSDYTGSGANQAGRDALISWARDAATENGVPLGSFFSVVVCMNVPTDLFGGGNGVVCDDGRWIEEGWAYDGMSSMSPSLLGQEMGHGYGLDHSRAAGSDAPYMDQWDVMSTANAFMAPHPFFTDLDVRGRTIFRLGPGLNAANMWSRGWLDQSRVWRAAGTEYGAVVRLRPLHRRDLPGYLAAQVGEFFFELRVPEVWDAGIGQAVVLVHDFAGGYSSIYTGQSGNQGLTAGDTFQRGDTTDPLGALLSVTVTSIDPVARTADLSVVVQPDRHPKAGPAQILAGVENDGGGWIFVGGKLVRVPPRSPLVRILEDVATLQESESIRYGAARDLLQRSALQSISAQADLQLQRTLSYREPAPAQLERTAVESPGVSVPKDSPGYGLTGSRGGVTRSVTED